MSSRNSDYEQFLLISQVKDWISNVEDQYERKDLEFPHFLLLKDRATDGKYNDQNGWAYILELHSYVDNVKHVLGGLQEKCQPGHDPGDDEDGTRGADKRSRLRSGGEVRTPCHGYPALADTTTGGTGQWKPQRTDCRRKRRGTWTVYEVS